MISLAQEDGADRFKLEVCTHTPGSGRSAIGMYTTYQWPALCADPHLRPDPRAGFLASQTAHQTTRVTRATPR
jgi:hypothetical protein